MASSPYTAVGLDLGSQKTMIVADDGEIIRTSTGMTYSLGVVCISCSECVVFT